MVMMQVTVPDGLLPGDSMNIAVGEQEFTITVPDGVMGGDPIDVDLPVAEEEPAEEPEAATTTVSIVVPDGCYEGTEFTVDFDGREFNIVVPDGVGPGETIEVGISAMRKTPVGLRDMPAEPRPIALHFSRPRSSCPRSRTTSSSSHQRSSLARLLGLQRNLWDVVPRCVA